MCLLTSSSFFCSWLLASVSCSQRWLNARSTLEHWARRLLAVSFRTCSTSVLTHTHTHANTRCASVLGHSHRSNPSVKLYLRLQLLRCSCVALDRLSWVNFVHDVLLHTLQQSGYRELAHRIRAHTH